MSFKTIMKTKLSLNTLLGNGERIEEKGHFLLDDINENGNPLQEE
jgi:hypothetical protein